MEQIKYYHCNTRIICLKCYNTLNENLKGIYIENIEKSKNIISKLQCNMCQINLQQYYKNNVDIIKCDESNNNILQEKHINKEFSFDNIYDNYVRN